MYIYIYIPIYVYTHTHTHYTYITTPPGAGQTFQTDSEKEGVVEVDAALAMAQVGAMMLLCAVVASVEQDGRRLDVKMHQASGANVLLTCC
jgi:hypothetical protein